MSSAIGSEEIKTWGLGILQCTEELLTQVTQIPPAQLTQTPPDQTKLDELAKALKFQPDYRMLAVRDIRDEGYDLFELFVISPKIPQKGQPHVLIATLIEGDEHINIRLYKEWLSPHL